MSKIQHTPWPWINNSEGIICYRDGDIAATYDLRRDHDGTEQEANARLIASAPELLEILERIVKVIDAGESINTLRNGASIQKARIVIAKAKGEA